MTGASIASPAVLQGSGAGIVKVNIGSDLLHSQRFSFKNFRLYRLGTSSVSAISAYNRTSAKNIFTLNDGSIDNCGQITLAGSDNSSDDLAINNVTFSNSLNSSTIQLPGTVSSPSGQRNFTGNIVDKTINLYGPGWTVTNNVFRRYIARAAALANTRVFFNNLIAPTVAGSVFLSPHATESIASNYWYATTDNPHFLNTTAAAGTNPNVSIRDNVFETDFSGGTDDGDIIFVPSTGKVMASGNVVISATGKTSFCYQIYMDGKKCTVGSPDLNLLIVYPYGWLYKMTGDPKYLTRGDQIFCRRSQRRVARAREAVCTELSFEF